MTVPISERVFEDAIEVALVHQFIHEVEEEDEAGPCHHGREDARPAIGF